MTRGDLRLGRMLAVWAPLAATFLLVTGSTPVVNASINRLPGRIHETDLAAFALFLSTIVVLHSPLFVAREIAIKLSIDRAGARGAMRFCIGAGFVIGALDMVLGATPLGRILLGAFADRADVVEIAHHAFLYVWPVPVLVGVRGIYQARQIQADDTLFVGLGTLLRLCFTAFFGLLLAPHLGISGTVLGAVAMALGIGLETIFAFYRARKLVPPAHVRHATRLSVAGFALPLMFANTLGVLASLFYLRVAGLVPERLQESSLAAFQEARPLTWLFAAGGFALQSLTTAKVRDRADEAPMLRFALVVGGGLAVGLSLCVFVVPLREWILVDLLGERPQGRVLAFAVPTLMWGCALPLMQSLRFTMRGILIARGRTRAITLTNIVALTLLTSAISFDLLATEKNGALNAYVLWTSILVVELAILARLVFRPGAGQAEWPPPARSPAESAGG